MADVIITPNMVAEAIAIDLSAQLVAMGLINTQYTKEFKKIGQSVDILEPVKMKAVSGAVIASIPDTVEKKQTLTIDQRFNTSWDHSTQDLTMSMKNYRERYAKPASIALAHQVNQTVLGLYTDIYNVIGTPGTTPSTLGIIGDVQQLLNEENVPHEDRCFVMGPAMNNKLTTGDLKSYFNQSLAEGLVRKGRVGELLQMDFFMDQQVNSHLTGSCTYAGITINDGSIAEGDTSMTVAGAGVSKTLKKGDVFTIAGVNAINTRSYVSTGALRNYTLTADATSDGAGAAVLNFSPEFRSAADTSGNAPYATIDALPVTTAALVFKTGGADETHPQNLAFHKDAFIMGVVPLEVPVGARFGARQKFQDISVRIIADHDFMSDQQRVRADIQFGVKTLRPELACRLIG
jgi:hypothetical protein